MKTLILVDENDKGFATLLENTMLSVIEQHSVYHIFFNAAVEGANSKNNVDVWLMLAKKLAETSFKVVKDEVLLTDEFILTLALRLAKHFKNELNNHFFHQQ